jgi:hypothetical protein
MNIRPEKVALTFNDQPDGTITQIEGRPSYCDVFDHRNMMVLFRGYNHY